MDFVHDTLAGGRPFRVMTVVDHWSCHNPVLEAGVRMKGERVGQILNRALNWMPDSRPSPWRIVRNSNHERWKIGPIGEVCSSTSFDPAKRFNISLKPDGSTISSVALTARSAT